MLAASVIDAGITAHLDAEQRDELGGVGLWIDSARLSPDDTVEAIVRGLS
jgi:hypothetical protein